MTIRDRIAAALVPHQHHPDHWVMGSQSHCGCGWKGPRHHFDDTPAAIVDEEHAAHVAATLVDALGLTEEEQSFYDHAEPYSTAYEYRWVSPWAREEQ